MKDLTQGSIGRHLAAMALPIAAGMVFQTLYFLVDLYFVSGLGPVSLAGVSAAGNVTFVVFAATQVLNIGTMALIAHAAGRKDRAEAGRVFNQGALLAALLAVATLAAGYPFARLYMGTLGADPAVTAAGIRYLDWFLPNLALQFPVAVMGAALRGTGIVKPTMLVQAFTVLLNALLAPVLIAGWGTGHALGVAGAGLASSGAIAVGTGMLAYYFLKLESFVRFDARALRPDFAAWRRILGVGLPAGGEFALMFVYMGLIYWIVRRFGAEAQAGFGVGMRVMQSLFLPAMAVAFAAGPIVGQNYAAGHPARVRRTFATAVLVTTLIMVPLTLLCRWRGGVFVAVFAGHGAALEVGTQFLRTIALNFVASGCVFACSAVFQGLGNTMPAVLSSAGRIVSFALPALWLASRPDFTLAELWYTSVASMTLQAVASLWLVRREFARRLPAASAHHAAAA